MILPAFRTGLDCSAPGHFRRCVLAQVGPVRVEEQLPQRAAPSEKLAKSTEIGVKHFCVRIPFYLSLDEPLLKETRGGERERGRLLGLGLGGEREVEKEGDYKEKRLRWS